MSLVILSFIKTPLFKGQTKQSHFLFPMMDVKTVSETIVSSFYSGRGHTIYLPGIMRYVAILVRPASSSSMHDTYVVNAAN